MPPLLLLGFWLAGLQNQPSILQSSIQGVVVRADNGGTAVQSQLPDARVELKPGNTVVFTDSAGSFRFYNLAPGQYTISVRHDGFMLQEDRGRGVTSSGLTVTVAAGQTLTGIVLPMAGAPVITGTVFGPNGVPLAAALVRTYSRRYSPYGSQLRAVKNAMTNDLGEFRLFGLNSGEYFVSAGYGDRDRAAAVRNVQLSANVSKADDGYATVFYDGGEDISHAQPVRLAAGSESAMLNIFLRDSVRFKIRGQVVPPTGGVKIQLAPRGSDLAEASYFIQSAAGGAFEIGGVSPGSYVLLGTTADGTMSSDVIPVNVTDSDVEGVPLALTNSAMISGTVLLEGNPRANLSGLRVKLERSTIEFDQSFEAGVSASGIFAFDHVPLTQYDITVEPLPPAAYVKSINSGSLSLLPGISRLVPGALQIILAIATDSVQVHVTDGKDPSSGAQVVLIPNGLMARRSDRYFTGMTDAAGYVTLAAVPPGDYRAFAFEQIEPGSYYALGYSLPAINRFRDRAVSASVGQNGGNGIELKVIPAAETAGGLQ